MRGLPELLRTTMEVPKLPRDPVRCAGDARAYQARTSEGNRTEAVTPVITTVLDAVRFFAQGGPSSTDKFLHLVLPESAEHYRPYDLKVVKSPDQHHTYYTMSASGMVYVTPGAPSEFIPLAEWLRQTTLFNMLRAIKFFKFYLHRKLFERWRANVRYQLFCHQRNSVGEQLFLAQESFCAPLLELKRHMLDLQNVRLMDLGAKTFDLTAFVERQTAVRAEATKRFDACMDQTSSVVARVCEAVRQQRANSHHSAEEAADPGTSPRYLSMVAIKKVEYDKRQLKRRAESEIAQLCDFIRLADYLSVESLIGLAVATTENFLDELKARKTGLFETTVQFTNEGTIFSPTCSAIQQMIGTTTDQMITVVSAVPRVVYMRAVAVQVSGAVRDPLDVSLTIKGLRPFQNTTTSINEKVARDFVAATDYAKSFGAVRPIYEYNRRWDYEVYKRQAHSVGSLKDEMQQIASWEKELEKMRARQTCGTLEVESRKLKQVLVPMMLEKMEALKGLVKSLARAKCKEQLNKYKGRIARLTQRPQHLKEFAGQVEAVDALRSQEKLLFKHTQMVEQMYQLLGHYDVKIASEELVQLDELRSFQSHYVDEMESANVCREESMREMTGQLDMNIARLDDQLLQLLGKLGEGPFTHGMHLDDPTPVLGELDLMKQKVDTIESLAGTYSRYQELFGVAKSPFDNLRKTLDAYEITSSLWATVLRWNEASEDWMTLPFSELDIDDLDQELQQLTVGGRVCS